MSNLSDLIVAAYDRPDLKPYLFKIGKIVRLKVGLSDDGQTPKYWNGAKVKIINQYASGLHKDHWYILQHSNGAIDDFKEHEIDQRYRVKS